MKIFANIREEEFVFHLQEDNGQGILKLGREKLTCSLTPLGQNRYSLLVNNQSYHVQILRAKKGYLVHQNGETYPVQVEDERTRTMRELVQHSALSSGESILQAPIPGLVRKIRVAVGDKVSAGDGVLVLEAMKMENEIKAESDGTVQQILVQEGNAVEKDQQLVVIG